MARARSKTLVQAMDLRCANGTRHVLNDGGGVPDYSRTSAGLRLDANFAVLTNLGTMH
jgi:hypothetical protein